MNQFPSAGLPEGRGPSAGLSHLPLVSNKSEFCLGLIRGLGSYLAKEQRIAFANNVFKLCGVRATTR